MLIDVLVAEIGSTTTVVNGFTGVGTNTDSPPRFVGQGQAPTSVLQGDVTIGLQQAIDSLKQSLNISELSYTKMFASSSAAGGLRMSVHGLVYDMTVKAAKEAALGAGAILKMATAGKMRRTDLIKLKEINPNIILIAGGVDYGERETALHNFEKIAELQLPVPIIYAGNCENHGEIELIAEQFGIQLSIVANVYPKVDEINVEPTRKVIQQVFEKHIVHAAGMESVRTMVNGPILPTPGAVMKAAQLLHTQLGNLVVFDVGGATTDVHSVCDDTEEISMILLHPEPKGKRTVEGDLGVFVNLPHIVEKIGMTKLLDIFPDAEELIANAKPIPQSEREVLFIERLTREAVHTALERHAGRVRTTYIMPRTKSIAEGKDLTGVQTIVATGGALTRLPNRVAILKTIENLYGESTLYPKPGFNVAIDNHYIMASLGVLAEEYPEAAITLLTESINNKQVQS